MKKICAITRWREIEKDLGTAERRPTIGLVPTMGALHQGHLSLVERSLRENEITIVSVFLNPVQFNNKNDFTSYPKTLDADSKLLSAAGVDYLFIPEYEGMYPDGYHYRLSENTVSKILCGASRPGHFDGVLTVVMKLLQIFHPDRAYFGEKDYQQYLLVDGMVKAFFLPTKIVPCPIIRESSGLAFSSRNSRLSSEGHTKASLFYRTLLSGKTPEEMRNLLEENGFIVDYIRKYGNRLYGAVFLENVRLIDNVECSR